MLGLQVRFLMDREAGAARKAEVKRGAHAYGALRKLGLNLAPKKDDRAQQRGLQQVDVALHHQAKEAQAQAKVQAESDRIVAEAEAAAREARKLAGRR